jgi:penicillin-binding protein 1A
MTTMMADVIDAGTASNARREGFTLPAAGKTGTTNDYHDAWFVGYTPKLVAGVWVGFDQPRTIMKGGYAAELAVPLWARFMKTATKGDRPEAFAVPSTVTTATICRLSGKLAAPGCHDAVYQDEAGELVRGSLEYTEYFAVGTEPVEYCPIHSSPGQTLLASDKPSPAPGVNTPSPMPGAITPPPAAPPPEGQKKRGFWGRLFGK